MFEIIYLKSFIVTRISLLITVIIHQENNFLAEFRIILKNFSHAFILKHVSEITDIVG